RDCLRALLEITPGRLLPSRQHLLRELHEMGAVRVERVLGKRGEGLLELLMPVFVGAELRLDGRARRRDQGQLCLRTLELLAGAVQLFGDGAQAGASGSEQVQREGERGGEQGEERGHAVSSLRATLAQGSDIACSSCWISSENRSPQ